MKIIEIKEYFLIILIISLSACEITTEIDLKIPYDKDIYPIGFIGNGFPAQIYIQYTQNPLNPDSIEYPENIQLTLKTNAKDYSCLNQDNIYYSENTGIVGQNYQLEIRSDNFLSKTSQIVRIPTVPVIDSLSYTISNISDNVKTEFFFHTQSGNRYFAYKINEYKNDTLYNNPYNESFMPLQENIFEMQVNTDSLLSHSFVISNFSNSNIQELDSISIILFCLDNNCFQFLKNMNIAEAENDIFSDPQINYSNFNNNRGIFGTFSTDTFSIKLNTKLNK